MSILQYILYEVKDVNILLYNIDIILYQPDTFIRLMIMVIEIDIYLQICYKITQYTALYYNFNEIFAGSTLMKLNAKCHHMQKAAHLKALACATQTKSTERLRKTFISTFIFRTYK